MHLGRFHAVIFDLANHFDSSNFINLFNNAIAQLSTYASSRAEEHLSDFRGALSEAYKASEIQDQDLLQPYAQQIIQELGLTDAFAPAFMKKINAALSIENFDTSGVVNRLTDISNELKSKIKHINSINTSFRDLDVEFQRVENGESEIGFLLPREVVGNSLKELSTEFSKLGKLAQAINEISGAGTYDPKVITISSSWWQIFLDLQPDQIVIWVLAIERIVNLFKANLEIKTLQQQLAKHQLPAEISEMVEKEIQKKLASGIDELAKEIRNRHDNKDDNRANELEIQLRQGLSYLAKRIGEGAQVEINVSLPDIPHEPTNEDSAAGLDAKINEQIAASKERIAALREMRDKARSASAQTYGLENSGVRLLIAEHEQDAAD